MWTPPTSCAAKASSVPTCISPNMATAVVLRCPWLGGGVKRILNEPKEAPGLIAIETLEPAPSAGPVFAPLGGGCGGRRGHLLGHARRPRFQIEWTDSPNRGFASDELRSALRSALEKPARRCRVPKKAMWRRRSKAAANSSRPSTRRRFWRTRRWRPRWQWRTCPSPRNAARCEHPCRTRRRRAASSRKALAIRLNPSR